MALETYRKKRDFKKTPEPSGARPAAPRGSSYVIQRHHARRLHYDFRLELDGVLVSWAVPKGPSFNPTERRLAVHVEDHPVEYGSFQGTIPAGEYGGGRVYLWDRGSWSATGDPREGLRRGKLKFTLKGEKLRGAWTLVRMRGRADEEGKENWLLIKEKDEFATAEGDVTEDRPESVAPEQGLDRTWRSNRGEDKAAAPAAAKKKPAIRGKLPEGARRAAMPDFIEPQLATLVEQAPEGGEWLHEIKFDGYRLVCRVDGKTVQILTRNKQDWTHRFPTLAKALKQLPVRQAWLDGEIVKLNEDGTSNFQELQNSMEESREQGLIYFAFDLLYLDGADLRGLPLERRKAVLAERIGPANDGTIRVSDHMEGQGDAFHRQACQYALEGIVSKRRDAPYRSGRGAEWVKVKCRDRQEFVIGGFTEPAGARKYFGALLLGVYDGDDHLLYSGRVGSGFNEESLKKLHERLEAMKTTRSPFRNPPRGAEAKGVHWVRPELVAEAEFSNWTEDDLLRQATFLGLRSDKDPRDIRREKPAGQRRGPAPQAPRPAISERGGESAVVAGVRISNPDRILYPDSGITKLQLAQYYEEAADWVLPYIEDRPLSLVRCPSGQQKTCFYQKHHNETTPEGIGSVRVPEAGKSSQYLRVDDLRGLVSLVQAGALEIHPWGSRARDLERPDTVTFDLDPGPGVPWDRVIVAAHQLRDLLAELDLVTFVKTTGGKGLHVVAPIRPEADWDTVKAWAKRIAEELARAEPDSYTAKLSKSDRNGKIFIDYLRNGRGATAVAAYSTRAREGAPVSTPLAWKELSAQLKSDHFKLPQMPRRLAALKNDPWRDYFSVRQSLKRALKEAGIRKGEAAVA